MKKKEIAEMFTRFQINNYSPKIELDYKNPYTLLIAVMLSAQSTDKGVNKATRDLFEFAYTPGAMLTLGEEGLKRYIKTIGLYNTKAKNIIITSRMLIEKFNNEVPNNRDDLMTLAGVGRKSANVILNSIFGKPTIAVDTHIFRVSNRIGLCIGKTPLSVELALEKKIPTTYKQKAHHWLVLHGRYTCKARTPLCGKCLISDLCKYENKAI